MKLINNCQFKSNKQIKGNLIIFIYFISAVLFSVIKTNSLSLYK